MESSRKQRIDNYVKTEKKSGFGAFILALLFGPVGYLYASALGGVIMILIAIGLATTVHPGAAIFVWVVAVIAAPLQVAEHNKKLRAKAELMAGD